MKNLVVVILLIVAATYGDAGIPNIVPPYAVSPLHHTVPPATINYDPSAAAKASEQVVHEPIFRYTKTPLAVKAPLATSYATTTSVHVTHEVPKVAVHEPVFKYHAGAAVKFATEPIYQYAASAPVFKFAEEPVAEPVYKYTESAPILKFGAESVAEPVYKYATSPPEAKFVPESISPPATPIFEHEEHSFDYAPSYSHGLTSLSSYH